MKFYKDHFGKWHDEKSFFDMAKIFQPCFSVCHSCAFECGYNGDIIRLCCSDVKEFNVSPSVIDYLLMDMCIDAIKRYREIHGCTLMKAREMVEKIEKDMEEMNK